MESCKLIWGTPHWRRKVTLDNLDGMYEKFTDIYTHYDNDCQDNTIISGMTDT